MAEYEALYRQAADEGINWECSAAEQAAADREVADALQAARAELAALRDRERRLREALETIEDEGSGWAVTVARAALAAGQPASMDAPAGNMDGKPEGREVERRTWIAIRSAERGYASRYSGCSGWSDLLDARLMETAPSLTNASVPDAELVDVEVIVRRREPPR
ncbi:MAG TPA: hypothetical protein VNS22_18785 [Geminicoccus sp.]|uniref:hypothetical protein n=1 Tax=Geminicoccus sp. TaxID=2024832 RepID=UPI002CAB4420|nr:hypothetical protein [Geminicoccus sp.]HWL70406.1 hypothetical protein [Geminicoccus sp.]